MDNEEKAVYTYLISTNIGAVHYEPDGNITPDFSVNSKIAIEVRRLNQNLFENDKTIGLEKFAIPLADAFNKTLETFNKEYVDRTYFVSIDFQRAGDNSIKDLKHQIRTCLEEFLKSDQSLPCEIMINDDVIIGFYEATNTPGILFKPAGGSDLDGGGEVFKTYSENLKYCITEKSRKVQPHLSKYSEWWLFLVDHLSWPLFDQDEITRIEKSIVDFGCFQKICILHANGKDLLSTLSPNNNYT